MDGISSDPFGKRGSNLSHPMPWLCVSSFAIFDDSANSRLGLYFLCLTWGQMILGCLSPSTAKISCLQRRPKSALRTSNQRLQNVHFNLYRYIRYRSLEAMDLVAGVRKEGSRGGRGEFKWEDVRDSQHRENYLGHSLMARTSPPFSSTSPLVTCD